MADERIVQSVKIVDPVTTSQIAPVAALSDAYANPNGLAVGAFLMGFDGVDWERVRVTNTGRIHVDVQAIAQTLVDDAPFTPATDRVFPLGAEFDDVTPDIVDEGDIGAVRMSSRRELYVQIRDAAGNERGLNVDSSGNIGVNVGAPSGTGIDTVTSAAVAAGASANLDSTDFGGLTKRLSGVDVTASVPIKAEIKQVDNDVETLRVVLFGRAGEPIQWRPPHKDYFAVTFGANAGFDGFRVTVTNMDTSEAADVYATIYAES